MFHAKNLFTHGHRKYTKLKEIFVFNAILLNGTIPLDLVLAFMGPLLYVEGVKILSSK